MDDESTTDRPPTTHASAMRPRFGAPAGAANSSVQDSNGQHPVQSRRHPARPRGFRADRTGQIPGAPTPEDVTRPGQPRYATGDHPGQPRYATGDDGAETPAISTSGSGSAGRWAAAAAGVAAVMVLIVALLAFRLGANSSGPADRPATGASATATSSGPTTLAAGDVYRLAVPSVVAITTSKGSLGTGFVVTGTGTIMTANHVISGGGDIAVIFADGTKSAATLLAGDTATDIAALAPTTLPEVVVPATLGGGVAVGADVVAIGNQLALVDSTTSGIVSGLNRTAKTDAGKLSGLIQFDAAVNPGSSGGPLLNNQGAVIAVVVSIADPGNDDSWSGIGFAVPIGSALGAVGGGPGGPLL